MNYSCFVNPNENPNITTRCQVGASLPYIIADTFLWYNSVFMYFHLTYSLVTLFFKDVLNASQFVLIVCEIKGNVNTDFKCNYV